MKATYLPLLLVGIVVTQIALRPKGGQLPPGATDKIVAALPKSAIAKPKKARRMLVFSKTNGFRHASIETGKYLLSEMGEKTGAFETVISDDLAEFTADRLKTYDVVCFLSTTGNVFLPHKKEMAKLSAEEKSKAQDLEKICKKNLMEFVKNGGGFVGIHAATDTCYEWKEYGRMINGYFDGHPWNSKTPVSIKVEPGQEKHPIVAMLDGQNLEFKEEIYQLKDPDDSKAVHMLLRLDTEKTNTKIRGVKRKDGDFGVAWIRNWEKGRVFYCSIGHNHEMYWNPKVVGHYLAGIQWAARDLEVPVSPAK